MRMYNHRLVLIESLSTSSVDILWNINLSEKTNENHTLYTNNALYWNTSSYIAYK